MLAVLDERREAVMSDSQGTVGPPSEKTDFNIRRARAHAFYFFGYLVEWQWFSQGCLLPHRRWPVKYHVFPHWDGRKTEFWNQGPVWWGRVYWFTFGLSVLKSLPERRTVEPRDGMKDIVGAWTRITNGDNYGTRQTDSRRD